MDVLGSILNTFIVVVYKYDGEFNVLFSVETSTSRFIYVTETKMVSELCCVNILFAVIHVCFWVSGKEEIE